MSYQPTRFGERIRELRKRRDWATRELAYHSGINHATIYAWENGSGMSPTVPKIQAIASALGVEWWPLVELAYGPRPDDLSRDAEARLMAALDDCPWDPADKRVVHTVVTSVMDRHAKIECSA